MQECHGLPEEAKKQDPPQMDSREWRHWYGAVKAASDDMDAALRDALKPKRKRDLGVHEAKRVYRAARDKLAALFAYADRGGWG
jgi:hypothetical protein